MFFWNFFAQNFSLPALSTQATTLAEGCIGGGDGAHLAVGRDGGRGDTGAAGGEGDQMFFAHIFQSLEPHLYIFIASMGVYLPGFLLPTQRGGTHMVFPASFFEQKKSSPWDAPCL